MNHEIAQLRHMYANMVNGGVKDSAAAKRIAEGLLAPVIEGLERVVAQQKKVQEPMFWVRLRSDGGYEGPIHHDAIESVRKSCGDWHPLYLETAPQKEALQADAERYRWLRSCNLAKHQAVREGFELGDENLDEAIDAARARLGEGSGHERTN